MLLDFQKIKCTYISFIPFSSIANPKKALQLSREALSSDTRNIFEPCLSVSRSASPPNSPQSLIWLSLLREWNAYSHIHETYTVHQLPGVLWRLRLADCIVQIEYRYQLLWSEHSTIWSNRFRNGASWCDVSVVELTNPRLCGAGLASDWFALGSFRSSDHNSQCGFSHVNNPRKCVSGSLHFFSSSWEHWT